MDREILPDPLSPLHTEPRAPYRFALTGAIVIAILIVAILGNVDAIDRYASDWRAQRLGKPISPPPCQLLKPTQVAHITVRLHPDGELVATCSIVERRS